VVDLRANAFACDDILMSVSGKINIIGLYGGDILIPAPGALLNQLVFFFTIEWAKEDPIEKITLKITLPNTEARQMEAIFQLPAHLKNDPKKKRVTLRHPFVMQNVLLYPGRIECLVATDKGEVETAPLWITTPEEMQKLTLV
jgi:hypothetical protein